MSFEQDCSRGQLGPRGQIQVNEVSITLQDVLQMLLPSLPWISVEHKGVGAAAVSHTFCLR